MWRLVPLWLSIGLGATLGWASTDTIYASDGVAEFTTRDLERGNYTAKWTYDDHSKQNINLGNFSVPDCGGGNLAVRVTVSINHAGGQGWLILNPVSGSTPIKERFILGGTDEISNSARWLPRRSRRELQEGSRQNAVTVKCVESDEEESSSTTEQSTALGEPTSTDAPSSQPSTSSYAASGTTPTLLPSSGTTPTLLPSSGTTPTLLPSSGTTPTLLPSSCTTGVPSSSTVVSNSPFEWSASSVGTPASSDPTSLASSPVAGPFTCTCYPFSGGF